MQEHFPAGARSAASQKRRTPEMQEQFPAVPRYGCPVPKTKEGSPEIARSISAAVSTSPSAAETRKHFRAQQPKTSAQIASEANFGRDEKVRAR
jgi:hypothetical protein